MSTTLLPSPRSWHVRSPGVPELDTPESGTPALQAWLEAPAPAARLEAAKLLHAMLAHGWSACTDGPCGGAERRLRIAAGFTTWLVYLRPQLPQAIRRIEHVPGPQADHHIS